MTATSIMPVGFRRPPPMRPMDFAGTSRNVASRSTHWSMSCRRCTRTSVLTPRLAISQAATTVLPNAVVAANTPVSCASIARAAAACSVLSAPWNVTSIEVPAAPLVPDNRLDAYVAQNLADLVEAPSRQADVMRVVLGAGDDARLVERRQAHGLRFVELRILKRRDAKQAVPETGVQPLLGDVELIAVDDLHRLRQRSDNRRVFAVTRGRRRPRLIVDVFLWKQPHTQDSAAPFRLLRDLLNVGAAHLAHARKERPLIDPWRERRHPGTRCCPAPARASAGARQSGCRTRPAASCPGWERGGRTNPARHPAGSPWSPSAGTSRAGEPSRQESHRRRRSRRVRRDRSETARAQRAHSGAHRSRGMPAESSRQPALSKSMARK